MIENHNNIVYTSFIGCDSPIFAVLALKHRLYSKPHWALKEMYHECIEHGKKEFFNWCGCMAFLEGIPIGIVFGDFGKYDRAVGYQINIFVRKKYRKNKIGSKLIAQLRSEFPNISLMHHAGDDQPNALLFYKKNNIPTRIELNDQIKKKNLQN